MPYESVDDSHLTWLEDTYLGYLDAWESAVEKHDGFGKSKKALMLLSSEICEGLRIIVHSCCWCQGAFTASQAEGQVSAQ